MDEVKVKVGSDPLVQRPMLSETPINRGNGNASNNFTNAIMFRMSQAKFGWLPIV